jgi:hypothetical protein
MYARSSLSEVQRAAAVALFDAGWAKRAKIDGAGRLGVHVRTAISRTLESHGLGHLPQELPPIQEDVVRLYLLGSPVADLIKAVLAPSDRGDDTLRTIGNSEAEKQLRQIRQIVCG